MVIDRNDRGSMPHKFEAVIKITDATLYNPFASVEDVCGPCARGRPLNLQLWAEH